MVSQIKNKVKSMTSISLNVFNGPGKPRNSGGINDDITVLITVPINDK